MGDTREYLEANVEELGREAAGFDDVVYEVLAPTRKKMVYVSDAELAMVERIRKEVDWNEGADEDEGDLVPSVREVLEWAISEGLVMLREKYGMSVKGKRK